METSDLAKRMKRYEAVSKTTLVTRVPVSLRIDWESLSYPDKRISEAF